MRWESFLRSWLWAAMVVGVLAGGCTPAPPSAPWVEPPLAPRWTARPVERPTDTEPRQVVDVNGSAGTVRTEQLVVVNRGDEPLEVSVSVSSVEAVDGELEYSVPEKVSDPAYWLRLPSGAGRVVVPAGSAEVVPVTITYPNTARTGEQLSAVTVTETPTGEVVHVPVRIRTDGALLSELTLDESVVAFRRPTWTPTRPGTATVTYRIENTGNTILRGPLTVQLDTAFDRKIPVVDRDEVVLLPGSVLEGTASATAWPTLAFRPEVLVEVPTVDSRGRDSTLVVSDIGEPLTAVPWAQIGTLALLLLATLVGWILLRAVARLLGGRSARRRRTEAVG